eukprot:356044-Chlamydomonas_euryale.AAC.4
MWTSGADTLGDVMRVRLVLVGWSCGVRFGSIKCRSRREGVGGEMQVRFDETGQQSHGDPLMLCPTTHLTMPCLIAMYPLSMWTHRACGHVAASLGGDRRRLLASHRSCPQLHLSSPVLPHTFTRAIPRHRWCKPRPSWMLPLARFLTPTLSHRLLSVIAVAEQAVG